MERPHLDPFSEELWYYQYLPSCEGGHQKAVVYCHNGPGFSSDEQKAVAHGHNGPDDQSKADQRITAVVNCHYGPTFRAGCEEL